eukprot:1871145-Amphidinium_carterae.1
MSIATSGRYWPIKVLQNSARNEGCFQLQQGTKKRHSLCNCGMGQTLDIPGSTAGTAIITYCIQQTEQLSLRIASNNLNKLQRNDGKKMQ